MSIKKLMGLTHGRRQHEEPAQDVADRKAQEDAIRKTLGKK